MKIGLKKLIGILLSIHFLFAASCPNMCSGHGSCGKGGICSCFPGWLEGDCSARSCPYGHGYVDPTTTPGGTLAERASLECSGQGTCDRTAGTCKCFPGYEGVSCDRLSCPNNCNNHGVCTAVKMLDLNEDSHSGSYYETDLSKIEVQGSGASFEYDGWDADQSYVCVCDGEYRGFDCSEKKCPTGYVETSDCDSPAKSTQTITITQDTNSADAKECMAYLEYTDQYNRIWYSDAFCVTCKDKTDGDTDNRGSCGVTTANGDGQGLILGWKEALLSLPVGVIDVSENDIDVSVTGSGGYTITTKITFGSQQTGKQNPIRIITEKDLKPTGNDAGKYKEWCGDCGSGYHGMTIDQLYLQTTAATQSAPAKAEVVGAAGANANYKALPVADNAHPVVAVVDGIPPLECSRNGICQRDTGLCSCFEGYYGNACTEQASML